MIEEELILGTCRVCESEEEDLEEGLCASCWDRQADGRGVKSTVSRKEATNAYRNSEAGKEYVSSYNKTDAAVEARKKYAGSGKGKLTRRRYVLSEKGQETKRLRQEKVARALLLASREESGLCGLCESSEHPTSFHLGGINGNG